MPFRKYHLRWEFSFYSGKKDGSLLRKSSLRERSGSTFLQAILARVHSRHLPVFFTGNSLHARTFLFLNYLFYIGVEPINNVVIVLGGQQRDSAIHIHVSILPKAPFPPRLPHNIEQSSLCYTVGHCWLSILNTAMNTCRSQTPKPPFPSTLPSHPGQP